MSRKNNNLRVLFLIIAILFISCNRHSIKKNNLKTLEPTVLEKRGVEIFQFWEFKNELSLWDTNFVQPTSIKLYEDSVSKMLGKESFKYILKELAVQDIFYNSLDTKNGDSINVQLVHSKVLGKIRPINYLESQLLDYQISKYPLLSHPTEFHGFILFHDSLNLVKVYFAASDQPWPPKPNIILEAIEIELKKGWIFKYHLHNHYEPKKNNYLGILAPSMTDSQYYMFLQEDYNLKNAIITNGFHTVEIKSEDFKKLKSPENN